MDKTVVEFPMTVKVETGQPYDDLLIKRIRQAEKAAAGFWATLDDDTRLAWILIVTEWLAEMLEGVDSWLPYSTAPVQNGDVIEIGLLVHMAEVDPLVVDTKVKLVKEQVKGLDA